MKHPLLSSWRRGVALVGAAALLAAVSLTRAQNLVGGDPSAAVASAVTLTEAETKELLGRRPDYAVPPRGPDAARVARKLERHVLEFVRGFLYQGFHHTLGISGYETYFNHPDHM